jgi:hypothetical protein
MLYIEAHRAVSRQQLGKHVPVETDMHAIIEVLLETVFVLGPCKGVIRRATEAKIVQKMFATLDKVNHDTGNIRGLNFAAVKHTTIQVTRLLS